MRPEVSNTLRSSEAPLFSILAVLLGLMIDPKVPGWQRSQRSCISAGPARTTVTLLGDPCISVRASSPTPRSNWNVSSGDFEITGFYEGWNSIHDPVIGAVLEVVLNERAVNER